MALSPIIVKCEFCKRDKSAYKRCCNFKKCMICDKIFKNKKDYNGHGCKIFYCHICDKSYPHINSLSRHIKSHQNNFDFKCTFCSFKTYRCDNLKRHQKQHFKNCVCKICDYQTTKALDLRRHYFEHH